MAFVSDGVHFRTYDFERNYELMVVGGGSDGATRFKITGPDLEFIFSAQTLEQKLRPDEVERLGSDFNTNHVVWRVNYWLDTLKPIIREALEAYIIGHGSPISNSTAYVRFGMKESIFDT